MPESQTILLVDDEDAIQTLLAYPLERDGYRVVQARDGDEALQRFAEEPEIDLVVLDIMLPDFDGLQVMKRIRGDGGQTPVLFLTAKDGLDDRIAGLVGGEQTEDGEHFARVGDGDGRAVTRIFRQREHVMGGGDGVACDGLQGGFARSDSPLPVRGPCGQVAGHGLQQSRQL